MGGKVSSMLTRQQTKYKRVFEKRFTVYQPFQSDSKFIWTVIHSHLSQKRKKPTRYNKLQLRSRGPFTNKYVNIRVLTIYKDGTPNTESINRVTSVPTINHRKARITSSPNPPGSTEALRNTDTRRNESPEYLVDEVVNHCHRSGDFDCKISGYEFTQKGGTWEPADHIPHLFIRRFWSRHSK